MVSDKQFQDALQQINQAFAQATARIERLERQVQALKDGPKVGRPRKDAA